MSRSVSIRAVFAPFLLVLILLASTSSQAQDESYKPQVDVASPDTAQASKAFKLAPGLKVELFAAEPLLANPVSFAIDERGRFFVAETFRHEAGVTDNRNHMAWLDVDMAAKTVADRVAMYKKFLSPTDFAKYGSEHERIRRIEDRDGDGKADHATVFADDFKDTAAGIGAGLLARKGDVYFTCIPDLYKLKDSNDDGKADVQETMSTGYGVHVAFLGHDLHGLKMGPDGRLYFSIGDRGLNVVNKEGKHLVAPDTGSVLRCEPDGSNLEIFATGLRNPQELAFDNFGNLFSCDNNSDGGDKARWVHIVEGGDSGWRMGYQYLDFPTSRGAWNAERIWYPRWDGQASYIIPPIINISDGPSGLVHDPGTGLPARYRDHFFLADFRGTNTNSGVRSFANKPKGASFELVDSEQLIWSVLATDVDFGPDGSVYVSDWVNGWKKPNKGRIWKITSEVVDPRAIEVKAILAEGMTGRKVEELIKLLGHVDQRVRLEAQYELADRSIAEFNGRPNGPDSRLMEMANTATGELLKAIPLADASLLTKVHAIWAIGQVSRRYPILTERLTRLLVHPAPEIRAEAAKVLGDIPPGKLDPAPLENLLKDDSPRVRYFAAMALARHGKHSSLSKILGLLRDNANQDATLRHAAVMALAGIANLEPMLQAADDPSPAVRLGILLTLRRLGRSQTAYFLNDRDPKIATEAGLAIYEAPIDEALPDLARLAGKPGLSDPLTRRALNAANRVGQPEDAAALASTAARKDASKNARVESLAILSAWPKPPGRDRINGLWRPIADRPAKVAADALLPVLPGLLRDGPDDIRHSAIEAVAGLHLKEAGPDLLSLVIENRGSAANRVEAIKALQTLDDPRLGEAVEAAVTSKDGSVRSEGLRVLARLSPDRAIPALSKVVEAGSTSEKQKALEVLGSSDRPEADAILVRALDRQAKQPNLAIELELLEASSKRKSSEVHDSLARVEASLPKTGPIADYRAMLEGGDAARGQKIYRDNAAVYCVRCHKVKGEGGEVGPELTGIGAKQPRTYLLESIVAPNQAIAQGFESVVVAKADGNVIMGVLKSEDSKTLKLMTAEAKLIEIPKSEIEERKRGNSAMPEDLHKKLTRLELRDVVEFLASLK